MTTGIYVSQEQPGLTAVVTIVPGYMSNGPTFGCHDADFWVEPSLEIETTNEELREEILISWEMGTLEKDLQK